MDPRKKVVFHDPRLASIAGGGEVMTLAMIDALDPERFECTVVSSALPHSRLFAEFRDRRPDVEFLSVVAARDGLPDQTRAFIDLHHGWDLWGRDDTVDDSLRFNSAACGVYAQRRFDVISLSLITDIVGLPAGPRAILHIGGTPPADIVAAEARLLGLFESRTAISRFIRDEFFALFGLPSTAGSARILPPALAAVFRTTPQAGRARDIDVLFAGRLTARKGIDALVDATLLLSQRLAAPRVVIVGDGPLASELRGRARGTSVEFTGAISQSELVSLLDRAKCFAYPTRKPEAFGLAPLEAMARGAVPIVGELGGMSEYAEPETNAFVLPASFDAENLAFTIESALQNPARLLAMAAAGAQTAAQFSWPKFVAGVNRAFTEVAENRVGQP